MTSARGFVCETAIRVRYAETDAMGVVHHSSYVVWLEAGRSDWMRRLGSSYAAFEASGRALPVIGLTLRYLAPARYDELVVVRTWVAEARSRSVRFAYEVVGESGELLATGETSHLCTTRDGRVVALPAETRELLGQGRKTGERSPNSSDSSREGP